MTTIQDLRGDSRILGPTNAKRNVSQVRNIARHHSATTSGDVWAFQNHWRGSLGWGTGGYHEIILRDGTVQLCYRDNDVTNGVGNHNTVTYHICLVGNGSFTEAQERAFDVRARDAMRRFGLTSANVLGHNEFSGHGSNQCPGVNMSIVRRRLADTAQTHDEIIAASAPKTVGNYVGKLEVFNELSLGIFRIAGWLVPINGAPYLSHGYVFWKEASTGAEVGRCTSRGIERNDVNKAYGLPNGLKFGLDGTLDIKKFAGKKVYPCLRRTNDKNGNSIAGKANGDGWIDIEFPEYVLTIPKR